MYCDILEKNIFLRASMVYCSQLYGIWLKKVSQQSFNEHFLKSTFSWLCFIVLQKCGYANKTVLLNAERGFKIRFGSILWAVYFFFQCAVHAYIHGLRIPNDTFFFYINIPNILSDWVDRLNKLWGILGYFW